MDKTDRRNMLKKLLAAGLAVFGTGVASGCPGGSTWEGSTAKGGGSNNVRFNVKAMNMNNVTEMVIDGRDAYIFRKLDENTREEIVVALDRRCTHKGCKVSYQRKENLLYCPCHHSTFAMDGKRLSGPAREPLKVYELIINGDSAEVIIEREPDKG